MSKKRIEWIDIVKGIGIILMVVGHAGNIPNIKLWIYSFHMPLFFIMAGYGFKMFDRSQFCGVSGLGRLIKRNIKAYLIPYLVLFVINFLLQFGIDIAKNFFGGGESLSEILKEYLLRGFLYSYDTSLPNCAPLWFLTCLFIAYLFFWILIQIKNDIIKAVIAVFYVIILAVVNKVEFAYEIDELPWHIDVAIIASVFMLFGYSMCKYIKHFDELNFQYRICILIAGLIVGSIIGIINGRINMVKNNYQNIILFVVGACLVSFSLINTIRITSKSWANITTRPLIFWGSNTLIIMGFNYFINSLIREFFTHFNFENTIIYTIVDVIIVMTGCGLMAIVWNKITLKCKNEL